MTTGHARIGPALAPSGPMASAPAARWHFPSARTVLLGSYFAVAAGLAIWWLVGQFLLWRVTRSARPVPEAIRDVFLGLAGPGSGRVVLLESDRIASPFTYTWRRPVILLPSTCATGASPAPSAMSWRTNGRTSRVATPGLEPRLPCRARPLLSTPVLVAEAPASPLPGLPGRLPGRRRGLGRGLRRVPRPPGAGPQVRPGRPRAGNRRPSLEPLPEGHHAHAGPRTAGAPLPGRLEPLPPPRPRPS